VIDGGLFYRRLASPLHATRPGAAVLWVLALILAALLLSHPLALLALLIAVFGAGAGAGVGRRLLRAARASAVVWVPIVLVNVLVSRQGLTVFARLGDLGPFGQGDLTLEAVAYGAIVALKVVLLLLVTTLAGLAIDPDGLLRIVRRLSFRSAVTASLATRLIPVLSADAQRLAEAQRTRPDNPAGGARARVGLLRAVVSTSLDRALDVAATLELRGYAAARRAPRLARPWSRHDLAFLASAAAIGGLAVLDRLDGALAFQAYPELQASFGPAQIALAVALAAAVLLPFCDRRGIAP
jgi:energy-coupling factor transport system permease protein